MEMTDSRCAECAISGNLQQQFEAEYERKAAEMRRMIDQAHEQIGVGVRDLTIAIARIKELEARIKELEAADD